VTTGTLQGSFNEKGFTFIHPDADSGVSGDVFLHIRHIRNGEDARSFVRGARVEFDVVMVMQAGAEKPQARGAALAADDRVASTSDPLSVGQRGTLKFWSALSYGFILDHNSREELYVNARSVPGGYLRHGDEIEFDVEQTPTGPQAVNIRVIGWSPTGDPFNDLIDMGSPTWAVQLANLAEDENWNYQVRPAKDPHTVLRSYLKYTFLRLNELPKHVVTSDDGSYLAFNTGLVTPFQEQLFALFRKRPLAEAGPPWVLRTFEKASSVVFLQMFGGALPPLAWYYDEPAQLVFDTRLSLSVNVEHVPHDPERFPSALKSLSPQDLAALVNAKAPEAVDRVRRNYKTAIPQFYRDGKSGAAKMQLLLPVALLRRDQVELALAVDRLGSGVYLGRTVLSLDWAYNNARLLTRPDSDWLRP
jgi:cold shock CspA family protein